EASVRWLTRYPVVIAVAVLLVIAFAYPLLAENTASECEATYALLYAIEAPASGNTFAAGMESIFGPAGGKVAARDAAREYPVLPEAVSCTLIYWRVLLGKRPKEYREQ
ncbi:MAG TPA: hypothetical protein VMA86_05640, partial [Acetobacteraceae bacterium]|nr:hypothetical protein [Acetobacteraceae bacterium]